MFPIEPAGGHNGDWVDSVCLGVLTVLNVGRIRPCGP